MKHKQYNSSSKIRVSGGDRMNRKRSRMPVEFEQASGSMPSLTSTRRKTAGLRDRSLDVETPDRRARGGGRILGPGAVDSVKPAKRRFRITSSAFTEPLHLDRSSSRLRNRFNDYFVLGGVPKAKKRRDDEIDIHRNRMLFLAFTACVAIYVLYKLLISP